MAVIHVLDKHTAELIAAGEGLVNSNLAILLGAELSL